MCWITVNKFKQYSIHPEDISDCSAPAKIPLLPVPMPFFVFACTSISRTWNYTHLNWPRRQTEVSTCEGYDFVTPSKETIHHVILQLITWVSRLRPSPAGNVTRMSNVQKYIHSLPSHTAPGGIQELLLQSDRRACSQSKIWMRNWNFSFGGDSQI